MRKADNPFEPGAGTKPPELAGRELVLEDAEAAIEKGLSGRPIRGQIYYGIRGVGKTVLLREAGAIARKHGGLVADLETPERKKLAQLLVPALRQLLIQLNRIEKGKAILSDAAAALQSFASVFKVKIESVGIEVKEPTGIADSGDLENDVADLLVALGEAAKSQKTMILLALDEMQYLDVAELSAIITGIHAVNQKGLPLGLFGAGLPHLLAKAGEAKSYSERLFLFEEVGPLADEDARKALRDPIVAAGAKINRNALDFILSKSQGYPYFIQEWGSRTWNAAKTSPITKSDALAAEPLTIRSLDRSFFRVRFDQLTVAEQNYLRAMAHLGPGPHKSGEVAKVLGKNATQTAAVRAKIITKGMAYGGQYGLVHFSVPLFDEFMRRAMPDFEPRQPRKRSK